MYSPHLSKEKEYLHTNSQKNNRVSLKKIVEEREQSTNLNGEANLVEQKPPSKCNDDKILKLSHKAIDDDHDIV